MADTSERTYFFMHIMKTAGTSFAQHLNANFAVDQIYPSPDAPPAQRQEQYWKIAPLRDLAPRDRAKIRMYHGHLPYLVGDMVSADVTLTMLRDPVERTISHIRHCQRHFGAHQGKPDEAVYEDGWLFPLFFRNYQIKQFALGTQDKPKAHNEDIIIDASREVTALANLDQVDLYGLTDQYQEFLARVSSRYGWAFGPERRLQVAPAPKPVSPSLRARIIADNAADIEFYRQACDRYDLAGG